MAYKRLHHVGIILPTVEQVYAFLSQYDLSIEAQGETSYQAAFFFTKPLKDETPIEFLVPHNGPLKAFNDGKGGIHHICFEVDDIEEVSRELRAIGCRLLEDETREDNHMKINFVRPHSSFGVLVELMAPV